jgi:hypothetical protein
VDVFGQRPVDVDGGRAEDRDPRIGRTQRAVDRELAANDSVSKTLKNQRDSAVANQITFTLVSAPQRAPIPAKVTSAVSTATRRRASVI